MRTGVPCATREIIMNLTLSIFLLLDTKAGIVRVRIQRMVHRNIISFMNMLLHKCHNYVPGSLFSFLLSGLFDVCTF